MGLLAIPLITAAITCFVLFIVIRNAIDGSEMAKNIDEIRKMLRASMTTGQGGTHSYAESSYDPEEAENIPALDRLDCSYEECPACHANVLETDAQCAACGFVFTGATQGQAEPTQAGPESGGRQ